jgi:hypothetical protein
MLYLILLIAAFICFALSSVNIGHPRINLSALGLACAALAFIVGRGA